MIARSTLFAAALALALSCASAPAFLMVQQQEEVAAPLFPAVTEDITLSASEGDLGHSGHASLLDLAEAYGAATNQHIMIRSVVRQQLSAVSCGLPAGTVLPGRAVQSMTEHLLSSQGYYLQIRRNQAPFMVEILNSEDPKNPLVSRALYRTPDQILADPDHPALIVSTVLYLASVDARQVSNVLRSVGTNRRLEVISALSEHSLSLIGPAQSVARWIRTLRAVVGPEIDDEEEAPVLSKMAQGIITLERAPALQVARHLTGLFSLQVKTNQIQFEVIADERTNSILIYCTEEAMPVATAFATMLDIEA